MNRRAVDVARSLALVFLCLAILPGCKLVELKMPGEPMAKEEFALRGQTRELGAVLSTTVQRTADDIASKTQDEAIRRRCVEWKIGVAGVVRNASLRSSPSLSLLDTWAFSRQLTQFLDQGAGAGFFGPHQSLALTNVQAIEARVSHLARTLVSPSEVGRMEEFLSDYTTRFPLKSLAFDREPVAARWEDFRKRPEPIPPAGTGSEAISDLAERLQILGQEVPQEVRWRLTLESEEMQRSLGRTGVTLDRLDTALKRIAEAAASSPASVSNAVLDLKGSFLPVLDRFEGQWQTTIKTLQTERQSLAADIATERAAVLKAVDQQREAILKQTHEISRDLVERSMNQVRGLIRDVLFYAVLLVAIVLGAPFAIGFFLGRAWGRMGAGRKPAEKPTPPSAPER